MTWKEVRILCRHRGGQKNLESPRFSVVVNHSAPTDDKAWHDTVCAISSAVLTVSTIRDTCSHKQYLILDVIDSHPTFSKPPGAAASMRSVLFQDLTIPYSVLVAMSFSRHKIVTGAECRLPPCCLALRFFHGCGSNLPVPEDLHP